MCVCGVGVCVCVCVCVVCVCVCVCVCVWCVCDIAYLFQTNHSRVTVIDFLFLPALKVRVSGKAVTDLLFLAVYWRLNSHCRSATKASQVLFCTLVPTPGNGLERP